MTLPAALPLSIGTVLQDTYEVTALLGQGGMGAVFLARHRRLPGLQVAVKVLLQGASIHSELYARFHREATIASQLGHPHIVQVLDFNSLPDGTPYLVMEYLRGESLEKRLQRGPLPVEQALGIARQVGSALQAAHRAGVIHRDLKPANILLVPTESGGSVGEHAKLLDFGISKLLDSRTVQTQEAVLMGTPQYMSPEQAQGHNREIDARTDLFALGCITYEMLSGRSPFGSGASAGSLLQVLYRIVHEPHEPLASRCPELPPHVTSAVERALSKRAQDRHPDVAAFVSELTGTPLQSFSPPAALAPPPAEDGGLDATLVPSDTLRTPAAGTEGLDATYVPSSTAPTPLADDGGLGATYVPANTARTPAADTLGLGATYVPSAAPPNTAPALASPSPTLRPEPAMAPPAAAPVAPVQPPPPARSNLPVAVGAVLLVLGVGAASWWLGASRPGDTPVSAPVAVAQPAQPATVAPPEPVRPPAPPTLEPAPAPQVAKPPPPAPRRTDSEELPAEVQSSLAQAEQVLETAPREAIRLAEASQRVRVTGASFSIIIRALCLQGDFNAKARWRQGKGQMTSSQRRQVTRYCASKDIPLD